MSVEIKSYKRGNIIVVEVSGDALDASNVQQFRSDVHLSLDGQRDIILDLAGIKFVDSSGIGALLSVLRRTNSLSGDVKLCNLQPNVKSLFELVRMTRLFETYESVDDAVAAFES